MTNEQLAVFLANFHARLADAIQEVDDSLPEGIERNKLWEYSGKDPSYFFMILLATPSTHPEDWTQIDGQVVLLNPLEIVLSDLDD